MSKNASDEPGFLTKPDYIVVTASADFERINRSHAGAIDTPQPDPWLEELIQNRIHRFPPSSNLMQIIVFYDGPSDDGIEEMRFSPLINPISGSRYGEASFLPFWDAVLDHGGWFEMLLSIGVQPVTFVLFVRDDEAINPDFRQMCREFAL